MQQALADPETRKLLMRAGSDVVGNAPQEFRAWQESEIETWGKVIRATGAGRESMRGPGGGGPQPRGIPGTLLTLFLLRRYNLGLTRARGGAVWQLVGLITRRSEVQILSPQPAL